MNAQELVNTAISHGQKGNFSKAIKFLKKALEKSPENPLILYNLGFAYQSAGKVKEAVDKYKNLLKIDPNNIETHLNLGQIYQSLNELEKSAKIYEQAIYIKPNSAEIYSNLGLSYFGQGNINKAIFCYNKAIEINPQAAKAYSNLGSLYSFLNKKDEAALNFRKAIKYESSNFKSYNFLGLIYLQKDNFTKAIKYFTRALKLDPNNEGILFGLGKAYRQWNSLQAIFYFNKALIIAPQYFDVLSSLYHESREICDWDRIEEIDNHLKEISAKGAMNQRFPGESPFDNVKRSNDPRNNLEIARIWSNIIEGQIQSLRPKFDFTPLKKRLPSDRIRVGYVSSDFRNHPIGYLVRHLFKNHDKNLFEIFAYSYGENDHSEPRKQIEKFAEHFVDLSKSGNVVSAKRIHKDKIDIFVDLMGFTKDSRIDVSAMKPAPIEINYLGFTGSMGSNFTDYIIADKVLIPPSDAKYYSEKIIYMPDGYQINGSYKVSKQHMTRSDFGLPEKGFIFGTFNQPEKTDPEIFNTWMTILKRVPNSIIWLFPRGQVVTRENIKKAAVVRGINPDRIVFAEKVPLEVHLARIKFCDLALDTHTYSGGATTSQILYSGVPVITLPGQNYISRMSASLVTCAGLPKLVVGSHKEYEDLAVELATNKEKLRSIKKKLSKNIKAGPMFKPEVFVKNLEKAYREIFAIFQKGQKPKQIQVLNL